MTERTCRGAFRKAGVYPFNPKAVLDEIPLKEIEKGRLTEPPPAADSTPATHSTPAADSTPAVDSTTPKQKGLGKALAPQAGPIDTPHNTAAVQSHVVAVLDELDSLAVQGISYNRTALRTNTNRDV